jgi:hypothetical protein
MCLPHLQVLHLCATVCPNQDTAFIGSVMWTCLQVIYSSFMISFDQVRLPGMTSPKAMLRGGGA